MIIICDIKEINFAGSRIMINIFRGVTGWRISDAFLAWVNRTVNTLGLLYGTWNGVWEVMRIHINKARPLRRDNVKVGFG
jgi:hypothetical protein